MSAQYSMSSSVNRELRRMIHAPVTYRLACLILLLLWPVSKLLSRRISHNKKDRAVRGQNRSAEHCAGCPATSNVLFAGQSVLLFSLTKGEREAHRRFPIRRQRTKNKRERKAPARNGKRHASCKEHMFTGRRLLSRPRRMRRRS